MSPRPRRGSILLEDGKVLEHRRFEGAQHRMRLRAPRVAAAARPGSFVHLRCDEQLAMRRPMSIMRADPDAGWFELLFRSVGLGTRLLAGQEVGARLSVLGPIGTPFEVLSGRSLPLLIGGGTGIPPVVFLAEHWREAGEDLDPLVLLGSESPFPFTVCAASRAVPGAPVEARSGMQALERRGIASRLASGAGYAGCHRGHVTDLACAWLDALPPRERGRVAVYACGPLPMLRAASALAAEFSLPGQACLEEYMACAVGGCAGCTVPIRTAAGLAMQRVCVDGPVFDIHRVVWPV